MIIGRRTVMRAGVAVVTLPLACGGGSAGPVEAGNVADVAEGSLKLFRNDRVFLGRDAGGLYGMTAVCTHQGCTVTEPGNPTAVITCPCHGSRFDRTGGVISGFAMRPLQHFKVEVATDGTVTIQADMPVDAADRTPVS